MVTKGNRENVESGLELWLLTACLKSLFIYCITYLVHVHNFGKNPDQTWTIEQMNPHLSSELLVSTLGWVAWYYHMDNSANTSVLAPKIVLSIFSTSHTPSLDFFISYPSFNYPDGKFWRGSFNPSASLTDLLSLHCHFYFLNISPASSLSLQLYPMSVWACWLVCSLQPVIPHWCQGSLRKACHCFHPLSLLYSSF